jgi:hypothetical protein
MIRLQYRDGIDIDSGLETKYQPSSRATTTWLEGSKEEFITKVMLDLHYLWSKPIGNDLIDLIGKRYKGIGTRIPKDKDGKPFPRSVTIKPGWGTLTDPKAFAIPKDAVSRLMVTKKVQAVKESISPAPSSPQEVVLPRGLSPAPSYSMQMPGIGTSVDVTYDPKMDYSRILKLKTPSFIALGHELIHALHFLSGDMHSFGDRDFDPVEVDGKEHKLKKFQLVEEARTVGAGTFANTRISENALRREWGLPLRQYYNFPGDCLVKDGAAERLPVPEVKKKWF